MVRRAVKVLVVGLLLACLVWCGAKRANRPTAAQDSGKAKQSMTREELLKALGNAGD